MQMYCFLLFLAFTCFPRPGARVAADASSDTWNHHIYEVKFRLEGQISTTQVQASDAGRAKELVLAQFGPKAKVLLTKRLK